MKRESGMRNNPSILLLDRLIAFRVGQSSLCQLGSKTVTFKILFSHKLGGLTFPNGGFFNKPSSSSPRGEKRFWKLLRFLLLPHTRLTMLSLPRKTKYKEKRQESHIQIGIAWWEQILRGALAFPRGQIHRFTPSLCISPHFPFLVFRLSHRLLILNDEFIDLSRNENQFLSSAPFSFYLHFYFFSLDDLTFSGEGGGIQFTVRTKKFQLRAFCYGKC